MQFDPKAQCASKFPTDTWMLSLAKTGTCGVFVFSVMSKDGQHESAQTSNRRRT